MRPVSRGRNEDHHDALDGVGCWPQNPNLELDTRIDFLGRVPDALFRAVYRNRRYRGGDATRLVLVYAVEDHATAL